MAKELNLQAIKDRVARGRLQGGNPTGGEEGPFHLYHLALDDLEALIAHVGDVPPRMGALGIPESQGGIVNLDAVGTTGSKASLETIQPPRAANITDEERAELLKVAEEHKE